MFSVYPRGISLAIQLVWVACVKDVKELYCKLSKTIQTMSDHALFTFMILAHSWNTINVCRIAEESSQWLLDRDSGNAATRAVLSLPSSTVYIDVLLSTDLSLSVDVCVFICICIYNSSNKSP